MPTFEKISPKPAETRVRPRPFEFRWLGRDILEASRRLGFDLLHRFSSFEFLRAGSLTERIGIKLLDIKKNLLEVFKPLDLKMGGSLDLLELAVMPPLAFKAIFMEKIAAALPEALRPALLDIQVIESPIPALNGGPLNYQVLPAEIIVKAGPQFEKNGTLTFTLPLPSVAEMPARTLALTFRSPEVKFGTGQLAGVLEESKLAVEVNRQLYHDPSLPVLNREAFEMDLKAVSETGAQTLAVAVGKVRAKEGEGIPQLLIKLGEVVKAKEGEVYALGDGQVAILMSNSTRLDMAEALGVAAIEVTKSYECQEIENIFMYNEVKAAPDQALRAESAVTQLSAAVQREKPAQGRLAFIPQTETAELAVKTGATLNQTVHYPPNMIKAERSEAQLEHLVAGRETEQVIRPSDQLRNRAVIAAAEGKAWEYDLQHWRAAKKGGTAEIDPGRGEARSEKVAELVKNIVSHLRQQGIESPLQSTAAVRTEIKDVPRVVPQEQSNKENQQQEQQQRKKKELKIGQEAMGERELVGDLANIVGMAKEAVSVEAKEKLFDLIFQRAIDNSSLRKVLLEMLDLFRYEQKHRSDSRLGDYFEPERVARLFESDPSLERELPPTARLVLNEIYNRVREELDPLYLEAEQLSAVNRAAMSLKSFGCKMPKKGPSKETYLQAVELLRSRGLLGAEEPTLDRIKEVLDLLSKDLTRVYSSIEKRTERYQSILDDIGSRYELDDTGMMSILRRVLIAELEIKEEGSVGGDVRQLKEALQAFYRNIHDYAGALGYERPKFVNILGDGEYLALSELLFAERPETETLYVSRKSMMTEMEYYEFLEEVKRNPAAVNEGKLVEKGLVYSRLYRKEGGKLTGIYMESTQAAKQFKADLAKQPDYAEAEAAARAHQVFLSEFTRRVEEERLAIPEFRAETDRIYDTQLAPLVSSGQPLIFIDTGLKGTIPSLLASLVDIKQKETRHHPLDDPGAGGALQAKIFVLSVEEAYAGVIPHLATGRAGAKTIEDMPRIHQAVLPNDIRLSSRPLGILYLMGLAAA